MKRKYGNSRDTADSEASVSSCPKTPIPYSIIASILSSHPTLNHYLKQNVYLTVSPSMWPKRKLKEAVAAQA